MEKQADYSDAQLCYAGVSIKPHSSPDRLWGGVAGTTGLPGGLLGIYVLGMGGFCGLFKHHKMVYSNFPSITVYDLGICQGGLQRIYMPQRVGPFVEFRDPTKVSKSPHIPAVEEVGLCTDSCISLHYGNHHLVNITELYMTVHLLRFLFSSCDIRFNCYTEDLTGLTNPSKRGRVIWY